MAWQLKPDTLVNRDLRCLARFPNLVNVQAGGDLLFTFGKKVVCFVIPKKTGPSYFRVASGWWDRWWAHFMRAKNSKRINFRNNRSSNSEPHMFVSRTLGRYPRLPPKAPNKERHFFRNCWWRVRSIFQEYVGEILDCWVWCHRCLVRVFSEWSSTSPFGFPSR